MPLERASAPWAAYLACTAARASAGTMVADACTFHEVGSMAGSASTSNSSANPLMSITYRSEAAALEERACIALLISRGWISEMSAEMLFAPQKSSISCVSRIPPISDPEMVLRPTTLNAWNERLSEGSPTMHTVPPVLSFLAYDAISCCTERVSTIKWKPETAAMAAGSLELTKVAPSASIVARLVSDVENTNTSLPIAIEILVHMCPRPPKPITPTFASLPLALAPWYTSGE
mmetsp:Transcript_31223/g.74123  ORF Transcript_31223/g.74123 Transcript_31223/m.74123 type:complete len:234 (+) Transcript_31223:105-806(+)